VEWSYRKISAEALAPVSVSVSVLVSVPFSVSVPVPVSGNPYKIFNVTASGGDCWLRNTDLVYYFGYG
jgi:hypothetical protein